MSRSKFVLAGIALLGTAGLCSAQTTGNQTKVRFVQPNGTPLPVDFYVVRDEHGVEVAPSTSSFSTYTFENVGRKVSFQASQKGLKNPGFELKLEDAPTVFVTVIADPTTGKVKSITQKPMRPKPPRKGNNVRSTRGGGTTSPLVVPGNDACANAIPIFDGVTAFSTIDATTDGAVVPGAQYDGQTYEDVWYLYTPTCNGTMTVSTCGTADYDTDLVLYEADTDDDGDFDALDAANITAGVEPALAANDDAGICAGFTSVVAATVAADKTYLVRVGGFGAGDEGTGTLLVSCGGAPSNDICGAPRNVDCGTSLETTNVAATSAFSDPAFSCSFGGPLAGEATMWFRFTATSTSAFVSTGNSIGVSDTLLAVYDGSCGSLVELACDDDSGPGLLSELCVGGLTVGQDYLVQVASFPGSTLGRLTIDVQCPGPCSSTCDDIAAACPILCGESFDTDNSAATTDPTDPAFSCRFGSPGQGVGTQWFTFVATATSAKIDTNASAGASDTLLAVYSGTPGSLVELGCSDDEGVGLLSEVCVDGLTVGQTYYVQVASFDAFSTGEITVSINCPCSGGTPNDDCATAIGLPAVPTSVVVDITGASSDIAVPCGVFSGPFQNVWYTVTGTGNTMTATTCNPGTIVSDTKIAVYCGDCLALVCVGGNDDDCAGGGPIFSSTVSWCSQAGATYFVTVGTFSEFTAPGVVQLDVFDDGVACTADVACLAQGACCLTDGTCVTTTVGDCSAQGGTYQGDGTSCSSNFITDGGFEAGIFAGTWAEDSSNFGTPLCNTGCGLGGGTGPRSGLIWAWFGGFLGGVESGSVEQSITIPVGATTLDFFLEIPVSSGNGVDFLNVKIDGVTVFTALENDPFYAGIGYKPASVPIAGFADGGVHTLRFESTTTGDDGLGGDALTNFFVDDVTLEVQTTDCTQCFTLDFETEDDFTTSIPNGAQVTTQYGSLVNISGAGSNLGPVTFDSTPGGPNDPSINDDMLVGYGNLLLLQSNTLPTQTIPGIYDLVTDDADGGDIVFDFTSPVNPQSVLLADINPEPNLGASITLIDENGKTRVYTVQPGYTGEYGDAGPWGVNLTVTTVQVGNAPGFRLTTATEQAGFLQNRVVRMVVHMTGFGAMDNLVFCR